MRDRESLASSGGAEKHLVRRISVNAVDNFRDCLWLVAGRLVGCAELEGRHGTDYTRARAARPAECYHSRAMALTANLLVVVGATAVGKTACSLDLAAALNGEVVSADSRYLYRGLDIGTAKPSMEEMARVPHHLIDVTTPDKPWSLAVYKREATRAIEEIYARGRLPLLVGGSGQYVRAIVEGWTIPPRPENDELRVDLQATSLQPGGREALRGRLAALDPDAAAAIDPRNLRRVIRALEVCLLTGRPFSAQLTKSLPSYDVFMLGLNMPRSQLYARIDKRIDAMLAAGWVDEVRGLVKWGYDWNLPAMSALGYRQIGAHLRGEIDLLQATRRIQRASRRLVRKQAAWFRAEEVRIQWYDFGEPALPAMKKDIAAWLAERQAAA